MNRRDFTGTVLTYGLLQMLWARDLFAGEVVLLGLADGQAVDVEPAAGEHPRDVREHAGLVLDEGRQHVAHSGGPFIGEGSRESYEPRPPGVAA